MATPADSGAAATNGSRSPHSWLLPRVAIVCGLGLLPAALVPGVGWVALLAALPVVLLAVAVAGAIARVLDGDVASLTERAVALARRALPSGEATTAPAQVLGAEMDALVGTISRSQVDSFLAAEKLEEARRLKSQSLANMSHELRSPLNSILGFSELLLRGMEGELAEENRPPLSEIQRTGRRLLRLINEILDTAKIEAGKLTLAPQAMVPAQLIRQVIQETRRSRDLPTTIDIVTELQPGMEPVAVDPIHFLNALGHLLGHATDVMSEGRIVLRVGDRQASGRRVFSVEIELVGQMPESEREQLFTGFRRVRDGNLGLAVPLARRLIELHGGSLLIEGAGSSSEGSSLRLAVLVPEGPRPTKLGMIRTMRSLPAIEAVPRKGRHVDSGRLVATVDPPPGTSSPQAAEAVQATATVTATAESASAPPAAERQGAPRSKPD